MTARHQLRFGRRLGRDRAAVDATPAPPVGETLQLARERKGVDLYRAERDTRIRLRYLQSLEEGDWDELPAPVYTKGFLRNYAIYLGLEPEDILDRWRDEMEALRTATRVAVVPPPMPLVEPGGRRFTLTPGMIVAGLVGLVVLLFVGYIGIQLLRFAEVTEVGLTYPTNVFSTIDAEQVTLKGTSDPLARIDVTGPGGLVSTVDADDTGAWQVEVDLARGRNDFTIVATDLETGRQSEPLQLAITVPLPTATPGPTSTAAPPSPIAMSVLAPISGTITANPTVTISGATTGTRITVSSTYLGAPGATPEPSLLPSLSPGASAPPTPAPAPAGPQLDVTVTDGTFSEQLLFPVGHWRVTVTAYATGLEPLEQEIDLTVAPVAPTDLTLVIDVAGRQSWIRILADGTRVPGYNGRVLRQGETHTFSAQSEFCIRSGNAGAISLTLNGVPLGPLGTGGEVGSWIVRANSEPQPAPDAC